MVRELQHTIFSNKQLAPEASLIATKIKTLIQQQDPDAEVILFGSRARGDAEMQSDWDILVLTNKNAEGLHYILNKELLFKIEMPYNVVISILVKNRKDWADLYSVTPLYDSIQKEGILL
jgi:uncharacterized protein